ncbi:atherin-like [Panicum virgatum]|uniref:atherin-like n=1 Tax=Panicum virgatum TaxID=38727 RepID=UPI0019D5BE8A|nr:atherin-like [Panicum virgatum]
MRLQAISVPAEPIPPAATSQQPPLLLLLAREAGSRCRSLGDASSSRICRPRPARAFAACPREQGRPELARGGAAHPRRPRRGLQSPRRPRAAGPHPRPPSATPRRPLTATAPSSASLFRAVRAAASSPASASSLPPPRHPQGTSGAATSQRRKPVPQPRFDGQQQPPAPDHQGHRKFTQFFACVGCTDQGGASLAA